jgi:branched-chain amino acid transport system substrate-binding protein
VPAPGTPIPDGALVVAGLYKLNGPNAVNDHAIRESGDLAAMELTGDLAVNVVHYACDTGGDATQAARALKWAVTELHAIAVVGPDTSDEVVKGIAPIVQQYGAVIVSPSATTPSITNLTDAGLIWRTCPSDRLQAKVLASLIPAAVKLDVVHVTPNTYADGLATQFSDVYTGAISKTVTFATGDTSMVAAKMDSPDYALLIADTDAPSLVASLENAAGQSMTQYLMTDSALAPTLWGPPSMQVGFPMLNRIRGTAPALPVDPDASAGIYRAFQQAFEAVPKFNGEDPSNTAFTANAYDAFYTIAIAAAVTPKPLTGAGIAANMKRLSATGGQMFPVGVNGYNAAVQALQASPTAQIKLYGASGPLGFDGNGDILTAPFEVWKIVMDSGGNPTFATDKVVTP